MAKETDRTALYLRVSTAPQERGESLAVQEERLRAFAAAREMTVVEVFRDVASGADRERPGLRAAVDSAGEWDAILVADVTRFGRSAGDSLRAVDRIHEAGAEVIDLDGRSSRDKLVFTILSAIAEHERESIADRTSSARRAMAARGEWATGPPPYGTRVPDDGPRVLALDEEEAGWIRRAAAKVMEGLTTGQAADWLHSQGAPTPSRGRARWKYPAVAQLLKSPRLHQGWVDWNGERIPHPEILDEATWRRLQAELDSRNPGGQRKPQRYPLTGHVLCTCGAIWRSWARYNSKDPDARFYGCSQRDRGPAELCDYGGPRKAFEAGWLEEVVWSHVKGMLTPDQFRERLDGERPTDPSELDRARDTVDRLEGELSRLYRMAASSDEGAMATAVKGAEAELAAARREESRLAAELADSEARADALGRARDAFDKVWWTEDPAEMAQVLDDLRVRVQLRQPEGDEVLAYVLTAELMPEPPFRVGVDAADFEKEMAELEAADQA